MTVFSRHCRAVSASVSVLTIKKCVKPCCHAFICQIKSDKNINMITNRLLHEIKNIHSVYSLRLASGSWIPFTFWGQLRMLDRGPQKLCWSQVSQSEGLST